MGSGRRSAVIFFLKFPYFFSRGCCRIRASCSHCFLLGFVGNMGEADVQLTHLPARHNSTVQCNTFQRDISSSRLFPRLRFNFLLQVETEHVRFTVRDTTSGRYQSVTVHAPVKSAQMLYRCYEMIAEVSVIRAPAVECDTRSYTLFMCYSGLYPIFIDFFVLTRSGLTGQRTLGCSLFAI